MGYKQGLNTDININDIDNNNFFAFFENELAVLVDDNIVEAQLVAAREQVQQNRRIRRKNFRLPNMTRWLSKLFCGRRGLVTLDDNINVHNANQNIPVNNRRGEFYV